MDDLILKKQNDAALLSDLTLITFVFKISKEAEEEARHINADLFKHSDASFVRGSSAFAPHITIYQAEFPDKNFEKVMDIVRMIVHDAEPVVFSPKDITIKRGYVGIGFEKTDAIKKMHYSFIENLNPLREGNIKNKYKQFFEEYSEDEKENIRQWGYPYVTDLYNPHLTFILLNSMGDADKVVSRIQWKQSFVSNTIEARFSQQNEKMVRQFPLKK